MSTTSDIKLARYQAECRRNAEHFKTLSDHIQRPLIKILVTDIAANFHKRSAGENSSK